jgi:hypothetical protein
MLADLFDGLTVHTFNLPYYFFSEPHFLSAKEEADYAFNVPI